MWFWLRVKVQDPDLDLFLPDSNFRCFFCLGMISVKKKNNNNNNICFLLSGFNRLEAISNSIKASFHIAKLKAKLYRDKKVTYNRTH